MLLVAGCGPSLSAGDTEACDIFFEATEQYHQAAVDFSADTSEAQVNLDRALPRAAALADDPDLVASIEQANDYWSEYRRTDDLTQGVLFTNSRGQVAEDCGR